MSINVSKKIEKTQGHVLLKVEKGYVSTDTNDFSLITNLNPPSDFNYIRICISCMFKTSDKYPSNYSIQIYPNSGSSIEVIQERSLTRYQTNSFANSEAYLPVHLEHLFKRQGEFSSDIPLDLSYIKLYLYEIKFEECYTTVEYYS